MESIIRSVCMFSDSLDLPGQPNRLAALEGLLTSHGFTVQTRRMCFGSNSFRDLHPIDDGDMYLSVGTLSLDQAKEQIDDFLAANSIAFNIDCTGSVQSDHVELLNTIIQSVPEKTFLFTFTFNNAASSPFFPSAAYERPGFSVGLQPTDLADGCDSLEDWFERMEDTWDQLMGVFSNTEDFLGIDSSVAPLFSGSSSLVNHIRRFAGSFSESVFSDIYTQISAFIKERNPRPVGLCGLMLPCLEDFELASEYELGNFTIERNLFLSLHSGLGIDTYPVGVDEPAHNVLEILKLVQALSNKYRKPLSARFVSDGTTRIGQRTGFNNRFLKNVIVRPLR